MPPRDPEREAVGRSIAAILMAKHIRQWGSIHVETILTEIGALAGFAAQIAIRRAVIEPQGLDPGTILVEAAAKSGERFYFSDFLNLLLFENTTRPPYSIWSYIAEALPEGERAIDIAEIVARTARTVGSVRFGEPRLPLDHMPRKLPRAALNEHWATIRKELEASVRSAGDWPFDLAVAAQWQIATARDAFPPALAARIVMEAAIPMSKIDPRSVPGA